MQLSTFQDKECPLLMTKNYCASQLSQAEKNDKRTT